MLGVAFFRSGTFDYAKATYDNASKKIIVKIGNTGPSAYTKICVEGTNGIKFMNAAPGEGFDPDAIASLASNGSSVAFEGDELLAADKSGYLCLEYEGDIDPAKLPLLVRIYRASDEMRIYTAVSAV
jgi:hypothetical protein